jgi:predicted nucleotidyltransferase
MDAPSTPVRPQFPQVDESRLAAFLATQPDVIVAYLFGSLAQGRATPRSDVDVAIVLADASDALAVAQRRLQLIAALEPFVRGEVDVVILNNASSVLQHEVLRHRHVLYGRDQAARVDFEVRAGKIYCDEQPLRDYFAQVMFDEIREGRFGGSRPRRS